MREIEVECECGRSARFTLPDLPTINLRASNITLPVHNDPVHSGAWRMPPPLQGVNPPRFRVDSIRWLPPLFDVNEIERVAGYHGGSRMQSVESDDE